VPTPATLFAGILSGAVGLAAFFYGKKQARLMTMLIGLVLIFLPYMIGNAPGLYAAGCALCAALYWFRD
jgi:hypothetical protein